MCVLMQRQMATWSRWAGAWISRKGRWFARAFRRDSRATTGTWTSSVTTGETLTKLLYRTHTMAAAAVSAVALPPNVGWQLSEPVRKEFETRVDFCMYFGSAIKSACERGIFSVKEGNVVAD